MKILCAHTFRGARVGSRSRLQQVRIDLNVHSTTIRLYHRRALPPVTDCHHNLGRHCLRIATAAVIQSHHCRFLSYVPVSRAYRFSVSGLRLDPRLLSAGSPPSRCGIQTQSIVHADPAVHHLWAFGIYQKCDHWKTSAASLNSLDLSLGMAGADDLLLDIPQYALVSVCVVTCLVLCALRPCVRCISPPDEKKTFHEL